MLQHRLLSLIWSPSSVTVADLFPSLSSPEQKTKSPTLLWFLLLFKNYSDPSTVTDPVNIQFCTMWTQMTLLNWLNVAVLYTRKHLNTINPVNVYVTAAHGAPRALCTGWFWGLTKLRAASACWVVTETSDCGHAACVALRRLQTGVMLLRWWWKHEPGGWGGRYMKVQL